MTAPAPVRPRPVARASRPPGRAGLLARVLRTEVRRGGGALTAALSAVLGVALLTDQRDVWAGRLPVLVAWQRSDLALVAALVAAIAVWQAQRERRSGAALLVESTARPGWHRVVLGWGAITTGGVLGHLVAFVLGAATVVAGPVPVTGGWGLSFVAGVVSLGATAAAGTLVGRLVPHRLVAPVMAVVVFVVTLFLGALGAATSNGGAAIWLLSPAVQQLHTTDRLGTGTTLLQAGWFAALTLALLALAAARPRARAVPAVLVAAAVGAGLVSGSGDRWIRDDGPASLVCTGDAPQVCVHRSIAFLLPDVDREVRAVFDRVAGTPELPTQVRPFWASGSGTGSDEDVVEIFVDLPATLDGRLADPEALRSWVLADVLYRSTCSSDEATTEQLDRWFATATALGELENGGSRLFWVREDPTEADAEQLTAVLTRLDRSAQDAALVEYLTAARTCDEAALDALRARLGAA